MLDRVGGRQGVLIRLALAGTLFTAFLAHPLAPAAAVPVTKELPLPENPEGPLLPGSRFGELFEEAQVAGAAADAVEAATRAVEAEVGRGEISLLRSLRAEALQKAAAHQAAIHQAQAYVKKWAGRLNRYLAGSPLAGHGDDFARSAYHHGIDPRLSAAIALKESGLGRHNAGAHNAWGVRSGKGWRSWGSWEAAIEGHAALIARYGKNSTPESMARRYCPPTWQQWAASVRGQMSRIG